MKKFVLPLIFAGIALAVDGALSYDIFDYPLNTVAGWGGVCLILFIVLCLAWTDSAKKNDKQNNSG